MKILGIDVGGTGIKGAPVDTKTGELLAPRHRILTPQPAKPKPVAEVVGEIARHFDWKGPIGAGFPAVIQHGIARTAANIHKNWINTDAAALFAESTGCPVVVVNDADAAGLAEMNFGAGKDQKGVILLVTIGTGLGTSVFVDGCLLPNTEFGHITEHFSRIALAQSGLDLTLEHNAREVYSLRKEQSLKEHIGTLFSKQVAENLLESRWKEKGMEIFALMGGANISRTNNKLQYVFLNGRYIKDKFISLIN